MDEFDGMYEIPRAIKYLVMVKYLERMRLIWKIHLNKRYIYLNNGLSIALLKFLQVLIEIIEDTDVDSGDLRAIQLIMMAFEN